MYEELRANESKEGLVPKRRRGVYEMRSCPYKALGTLEIGVVPRVARQQTVVDWARRFAIVGGSSSVGHRLGVRKRRCARGKGELREKGGDQGDLHGER